MTVLRGSLHTTRTVVMSTQILTHGRLRELLDYNQETGAFTRKITTSSRALVGGVAGYADGAGYLQARIDGKQYRLHRLAIFYMTGVWPPQDVDHINRDRNDNRIANLRCVTRVENSHNKTLPANNTSGYLGVSWAANVHKWGAQIVSDGKSKTLGYFPSAQLASAAYLAAKKQLHPTAPTQ